MKAYMGIDIGKSGAVAMILENGELLLEDIPTIKIDGYVNINIPGLHEMLKEFRDVYEVRLCIIEKVHSFSGQGVKSMFSFGQTNGIILALLTTLDIPFLKVAPAKWKKAIFCGTGKTKDDSRYLAMELFPKERSLFKYKKDHNRADAALMAVFAKKEFNGKE